MFTRILVIILLILLCTFTVSGNAMCFWVLPRFAGLVVTSDVLIVAWNAHSSARIAAFDIKTGKLRWQQTKSNVDALAPLIGCDTTLYASTMLDGVFVRDVRTGVLKKHLQPGYSGGTIACAPGVVLIANSGGKWSNHLEAFDTSDYHLMWKRDIPSSTIWDMTFDDGTFKLLITKPWSYEIHQYPAPQKPEIIILSVQDGKVISRKPGKQPDLWGSIPTNLPKPIYQWLKKKGAPDPETEFENIGDCWFFGSSEYNNMPSKLFAVKGDTASIVWQRYIPQIAAIRLYRGIIYVAASRTYEYSTDKNNSRVLAVEPKTGKVLWSTRVYD